jgi:hypothetical protein
VKRAERAAQESEPSRINNMIAIALSIVVVYLSVAPVLNLVSGRQLMNYSYDPLDLVNTYGAFGTVGRERDEIIFEGTEDSVITSDTKWKEYEFKAKPGDPNRRPPFVAPYQPRIDWQIWFAAMASPGDYPWTLHFVWKLLHNDPGTLSLLQTIRSRPRLLITSGRDSIVIDSLPSARKHGGNANQLANGYPHSRQTIPNFAVCSKGWIGRIETIETSTVTNFVSTNRIHVEACPGCQRKFSGANR